MLVQRASGSLRFNLTKRLTLKLYCYFKILKLARASTEQKQNLTKHLIIYAMLS